MPVKRRSAGVVALRAALSAALCAALLAVGGACGSPAPPVTLPAEIDQGDDGHDWAAALVVRDRAGEIVSATVDPNVAGDLQALNAQVIFHSYNEYGDGTSALWLYDSATHQVTSVGADWRRLKDPMNAFFWPGSTVGNRWIVFMAFEGEVWHIYMYNLDLGGQPIRLSYGNDRTEDPKFSADGELLYLKINGDIYSSHLAWDGDKPTLQPLTRLTDTEWTDDIREDAYLGDHKSIERGDGEESMPFPSNDGQSVYFVRGSHANADVWRMDLATEDRTPVLTTPDVSDYYPIVSANGTVFFIRWASAEDWHDEIYTLDPGATQPRQLVAKPGGNVSDPAPVPGPDLLVFSMMCDDNQTYALYVLDVPAGAIAKLPLDSVPFNHLGASVWLPK